MHPDTYRMAIFKGPISPHMFPHGANGMFELIFDCKPQRFFKIGRTGNTNPKQTSNFQFLDASISSYSNFRNWFW